MAGTGVLTGRRTRPDRRARRTADRGDPALDRGPCERRARTRARGHERVRGAVHLRDAYCRRPRARRDRYRERLQQRGGCPRRRAVTRADVPARTGARGPRTLPRRSGAGRCFPRGCPGARQRERPSAGRDPACRPRRVRRRGRPPVRRRRPWRHLSRARDRRHRGHPGVRLDVRHRVPGRRGQATSRARPAQAAPAARGPHPLALARGPRLRPGLRSQAAVDHQGAPQDARRPGSPRGS
jgi:hypothetical protein